MKPLVCRVWVQATMPSKCLRIILATTFWRNAGAHDIGAPLLEHGGDDTDLLAIEDCAQMLAIKPGAGGAFAGGLGDQGIKVSAAGSGQAVAVLEQRPAQPLEARIGSLFEPPGPVEGGGGMGDDGGTCRR